MMSELEERLNRSRKELFDLSASNWLLSMPLKGAKILPAIGSDTQAIFERLFIQEKSLSFKGVSTNAKRNFPPRHFHAELTIDQLHSKLKSIRKEARSLVQECAVNFLYITLGSLEWIDTKEKNKEKYSRAPLLMIPVSLNHDRGSDQYSVAWQNDEVQENVCLVEMLWMDHSIRIPSFRVRDKQEEAVARYFAKVSKSLHKKTDWRIHENDVRLGIFNPNNMLIYRDLDPEKWMDSEGGAATSLSSLLNMGSDCLVKKIVLDRDLDESIEISRLDHVVDADSSQTVAIEKVRSGENMVIQGPPGTGKSQTITNIIATAVLDGKSVLFVAEKQTALDVVMKNMEAAGLASLCMMVGPDTKKTAFLEDIKTTWNSEPPETLTPPDLLQRLETARRTLNNHAKQLHSRLGGLDENLYEISGQLALGGSDEIDQHHFTIKEEAPWTRERFGECLHASRELVESYNAIVPPHINPWRGVEKKQMVAKMDIPTIRGAVLSLCNKITELSDGASSMVSALGIETPSTLGAIARLGEAAGFASTAPDFAVSGLPRVFWESDHEPLIRLVKLGKECAERRRILDLTVKPEAYEADFSDDASKIRLFGNSFRAWLVPSYRKSLSRISGFMLSPLPWSHSEKIRIIESVVEVQQKIKSLGDSNALGVTAFGNMWRGKETDWAFLMEILNWAGNCKNKDLLPLSLEALARIREQKALKSWSDWLTENSRLALHLLGELQLLLEFRADEVFGTTDLEKIALKDIMEKLSLWRDEMENLPAWSRWNEAKSRMECLNLADITHRLEAGLMNSTSVTESLTTSYYRKLLEKGWRDFPSLASFNGNMHSGNVERFRELDSARLQLARSKILDTYHSRRRPYDGSDPEARYIISQFGKKKNILPIRELMKHSGDLIRSIKPVFMMSPLSVAQYLERGKVAFDLMVIDEASQMPAVEALGTAARCAQHVVVGDSKQLPPSSYFKRNSITDDAPPEEDDEEEESIDPVSTDMSDMESILALCNSRGLGNTMLMGHYRSRHPSLIAFSNASFYEHQLSVVPSPSLLSDDLGLKLHPVSNGIYYSTKGNPIEAESVVQAIIDHYRNPRGRSLGVIALNEIQQKLIESKIQAAGFSKEEIAAGIPDSNGREPFDIWTIEKVQGHERDVILISVGYGPDQNGLPPKQNFGFISRKGGERRLNVMITRAKFLCVVFSSLKSSQIRDDETKSARMAFKGFLQNAENGGERYNRIQTTDARDPLLASIEKAIASLEYKCERNVGASEFKIDIAVIDPEIPGRCLMGILTDGENYRSARSARDRDRLRETVLKSNGWSIHRIWSQDWLKDPEGSTESLRHALEKALSQRQTAKVKASKDMGATYPECVEYRIASPIWRKGPDLENMQPSRIAKLVRDIVTEEGTIHPSVLRNRIKQVCGITSLRSEITRAIDNATRICIQEGSLLDKEGYLEASGSIPKIRFRGNLGPQAPRAEHIPPDELRLAVERILLEHPAIEGEDLLKAISKLLGYSTRNLTLAGSVEKEIDKVRQATRMKLRSQGLV
jgi:hypothetical protein